MEPILKGEQRPVNSSLKLGRREKILLRHRAGLQAWSAQEECREVGTLWMDRYRLLEAKKPEYRNMEFGKRVEWNRGGYNSEPQKESPYCMDRTPIGAFVELLEQGANRANYVSMWRTCSMGSCGKTEKSEPEWSVQGYARR
jgi:hypothetical protein